MRSVEIARESHLRMFIGLFIVPPADPAQKAMTIGARTAEDESRELFT